MTYTLLIIGALVLLGIVAALSQRHGDDDTVVVADGCASCNGDNDQCEQECMMEAATKPIEYYDDEELDVYAGRESDAYSDDEADEFREVLTTLLPTDVKGWNRSLILRGINVPDQIKDEMVMMME